MPKHRNANPSRPANLIYTAFNKNGCNIYWLTSDFTLKKLQAQGLWPSGAVGELEFEEQELAMRTFADNIKALEIGLPIDDVAVDLDIGHFRLIGTLSNLYENGELTLPLRQSQR